MGTVLRRWWPQVVALMMATLVLAGWHYGWLLSGSPYHRRVLLSQIGQCALETVTPRESGSILAQVGLMQYDGNRHFADVATNLDNTLALASEAVAAGADIIVLPEGATTGYGNPELGTWCRPGVDRAKGEHADYACHDVSTVAQAVPGGAVEARWTEFSTSHGVFVLFSMIREEQGRYFNTLGITGPAGFVTRYDKIKLMPEELAYAEPGAGPLVWESPWGRFGLMICNDTWWGQPQFRHYQRAQVDGLLVSTFWASSPDTVGSIYDAKYHFARRALEYGFDTYVADSAASDGTGLYPRCGLRPERAAMPMRALGQAGVALVPISR